MNDLTHLKLFADFFKFVCTWNQLERQAKQLYALWFGDEYDGFVAANGQGVKQLSDMLKSLLRKNVALSGNQFCLNFIDGFCIIRRYRNFLVHETWGLLHDDGGELKLIFAGVPDVAGPAVRYCQLPCEFVAEILKKLDRLMSLAAALQRNAGVSNSRFFDALGANLEVYEWPEEFDSFLRSHQIVQTVVPNLATD